MKILFATSECAPLVKTGGLGDVSAALPAALAALGLDVRVLLPGYPPVLEADPIAPELARLDVFGHPVRLLATKLPNGVPVIVADCPPLFHRGGGPYQADDGEDWSDNALRFGVLSRVAAILGSEQSPLQWKPEIVHCNDWQAALAPVYLHHAPGKRAASLLTIHNLAFQGVYSHHELATLQIPFSAMGIEGMEFYGRLSFLKGGIVFADAVNTVSPTYADEIKQEKLGFGLDGVLRKRGERLFGVLNGIDTALWDPQNDPWLPSKYGPLTLEKKLPNKLALKHRLGLGGGSDVPLLAMVSRLTHQKGIDLVLDAAPQILKLGAQLAVVGTGERELVNRLRALHTRHPEQVAIFIGFDESLAHLVEGGADMFLMPSRFEPCGMNQMYSQRYGTPPIGNATGGLVDTILDENYAALVPGVPLKPTGFLMQEATSTALLETVDRALHQWHDPKRWRPLQLNGMARDFGWTTAAKEYRQIYEKISEG